MPITVHGSNWNSATDDAVVGQAESILMTPGGVVEAEVKQLEFRCLLRRFTSEWLSLGPLHRL